MQLAMTPGTDPGTVVVDGGTVVVDGGAVVVDGGAVVGDVDGAVVANDLRPAWGLPPQRLP